MRPPVAEQAETRRRTVYGLAGGVGASTIAAALSAVDCGVYLGTPPAQREAVWPVLVVPVQPDRLAGLEETVAAHRADPPWLTVAVALDGHGRPPAATRALLRTVEPYVRALVTVPFVARWRWRGADPARAPRRWQRAISALADTTPTETSAIAKEVAA